MSEIEGVLEPEREPEDEAEPSMRMPAPPASFEFLVLSLRTQAEMAMGLFHLGRGEGQEFKADFELARHGIDMLGLLFDKTKGNLTVEEHRLLENSLTELRFRYIQAVEASKKDQKE
ncbi:MAG: DUF1844 domain-containing protein [Bryobacteraceae bacterium]